MGMMGWGMGDGDGKMGRVNGRQFLRSTCSIRARDIPAYR